MRRALDLLFRGSEAAGALFVFLIFAMILIQVLFGVLDRVLVGLGGRSAGLSVPAYAEISAYLLAAGMFLALAGTLNSRVHVRVSLVLQSMPAAARRVMEIAGAAVGSLVAGYYAWRAIRLAYGSWLYSDLSYGMIVIPMWLPQLPMALGLIVLTVAFLDYLVREIRAAPGDDPPDGEQG